VEEIRPRRCSNGHTVDDGLDRCAICNRRPMPPGATAQQDGSPQPTRHQIRQFLEPVPLGLFAIAISVVIGSTIIASSASEESEAYKQGYSHGRESLGVTDCEISKRDWMGVDDRLATPQEVSDWESGCRDGGRDAP
jgi:hypothetical protein